MQLTVPKRLINTCPQRWSNHHLQSEQPKMCFCGELLNQLNHHERKSESDITRPYSYKVSFPFLTRRQFVCLSIPPCLCVSWIKRRNFSNKNEQPKPLICVANRSCAPSSSQNAQWTKIYKRPTTMSFLTLLSDVANKLLS